MNSKPSPTSLSMVGLIPAGGRADRLAPLPCSKEILPIGFYHSSAKGQQRPKVACHYLLDSMRLAGVEKAFIVLRSGKWDIPAYFGSGESFGIDLAYLIRKLPFGVPFTLDCAFPFIENCMVACGLPDIIFQPEDAFQQLFHKHDTSGAALVLGLFPSKQLNKWDMVELDNFGRIERIVPKPHSGKAGYTWSISIWSPEFTHFLHRYIGQSIAAIKAADDIPKQDEIPLGQVFQAALAEGLPVEHVIFEDGECLDIGTPEDLRTALCMQLGTV